MKQQLTISALVTTLALSCGFALAADQAPGQEQIYGSQLMTQQERNAHQAKMRAANTSEEREQIRKEHHEQMKERANVRGVSLPDEPPASGSGMGPGNGQGQSGSGMGSGRGRRNR